MEHCCGDSKTLPKAARAEDAPRTQTVLVTPDEKGYERYRRLLQGFKVPTPPGYVNFSFGDCGQPRLAGCMRWTTPTATVKLTPRGRNSRTFSHEIGHVFDLYVLAPTGYRERFAEIVGLRWRTPKSEEQFADAYSVCVHNRRLRQTLWTGYGLKLTPRRHLRICSLVRDAYVAWLELPEKPYGQTPPG